MSRRFMNNNICIFILLIVSIGKLISAHAASNLTDINVNELKDSVVNNLPEGVTLPPEFSNIDINDGVDKAKDAFKLKCNENSGSDAAFEEASQATTTLMECVQEIIDFGVLEKEIEESKPNGNLDTVFAKYCNKRTDALNCVEAFTKSLDPCLTKEEKDQKAVFINIAKSLLEFVCHENGNQIALFIAEEGPECFKSKQTHLIECFNNTMGKYVNNEIPSIENLPTLVIKDENCIDMDKLEVCVVNELEQCKESTPANLVEALFRFVRKETPCGKKVKAAHNNNNPNSSAAANFSFNVLLGTWIMAVCAKFIVSYQ